MRRIGIVLVALVAAALAFGIFSMTVYNRAHNEQMYVAAGYLLAQGQRLYRDFAFVQMPYAPWSYALFYGITGGVAGGGDYLLKAKLLNFAWMGLAAGLLLMRARRASQDIVLALLLLVFFWANYYLLRATIEASNYALPIACALAAYVIWLRGVEGRMNYALACGLTGLALALAVGAKLYYAALALPFGVALLLYPRTLTLGKRLTHGLLPMMGGGIVGLLPVFYYATRDSDRFYFNNLGYHLLNTQWRLANGFDESLGLKLDTARDLLANPNYLVLELWLAAALLLWWSEGDPHERPRHLPAPGVMLAGLASLTTLVTAFSPTPLFPQYFAMPVPFLLLWMAEVFGQIGNRARRVLIGLALVCARAAILPVWPRHTQTYARFWRGEPWSGEVAAVESRLIHQAIEANGAGDGMPPKLATLSPILALEAGMDFYPELATGSFVLRVGDLLSPEQRARYVATSPSTLAALLDAEPPAAILIGDEGDAETPLRQYAEQHDYQRVELELDAGELWLR